MAIILKNAPKTEAYKGLKMSTEKEEGFKLVFSLDMEAQQTEIAEIWDPEKEV